MSIPGRSKPDFPSPTGPHACQSSSMCCTCPPQALLVKRMYTKLCDHRVLYVEKGKMRRCYFHPPGREASWRRFWLTLSPQRMEPLASLTNNAICQSIESALGLIKKWATDCKQDFVHHSPLITVYHAVCNPSMPPNVMLNSPSRGYFLYH